MFVPSKISTVEPASALPDRVGVLSFVRLFSVLPSTVTSLPLTLPFTTPPATSSVTLSNVTLVPVSTVIVAGSEALIAFVAGDEAVIL